MTKPIPVLLQAPPKSSDHGLGSEQAILTLLEYGDYECPFCGRASGIVARLRKAFGDDLRFVFRNFPLASIHPHALDAARVAECAGLQGQFWKMHELLFENQDEIEEDTLLDIARRAELDWERFMSDLKGHEVDQRIEHDIRGGIRSQVEGTPTFFINGIRYDGDWAFEPFLSYLMELRMMLKTAA
jgi:protein-disulfide isomerase